MSYPILTAVLINIVAGLALEALGARYAWSWATPLVGLVTFVHFLYYVLRPPSIGTMRIPRISLILCFLLALGGELFLSQFWGLYQYRNTELPIFVPPGHVLLFLAGFEATTHPLCGARFARAIPLIAIPLLVSRIYNGNDLISLPLLLLFIACWVWGRERALYSVMLVLALLLEIYGTALGTWVWQPTVPILDFSSANPPLAAGVFYAVLDLLTVQFTLLRPPRPEPIPDLGQLQNIDTSS